MSSGLGRLGILRAQLSLLEDLHEATSFPIIIATINKGRVLSLSNLPTCFHPCRFRSSYTIVIPLPCSDHLDKYINQVQQAWNDVLENTMVDDLKKIELPNYELLVKDAIMSY